MASQFIKGRIVDSQGRPLQHDLQLNIQEIPAGLATDKIVVFGNDGLVRYVTQAQLIAEAVEQAVAEIEASSTGSSSGDVGDILSANNKLTVSQPDLQAGDVTLTLVEANIDHDALTNFVADEHVAHSGVTLTAGVGLSGGGTIASSRTFDLDITELTEDTSPDEAADFLVTYDTSDAAHKKVKPDNIQPNVTNATGTLPINRGGTGQTTQTAAFDALAPTTTQGDTMYHDGSDNVRLAKGTAGQVLRMNAGATAPEWGAAGGGTSQWVTKVKTADESITSDNTVNADADLQFTAAANTNYMVRIMLAIFSASSTPDFKWNITYSGTETDSIATSWRLDDGSTAINNQLGDAAPGTGDNTITLTANELNIVWIHYFLRSGASGGTVNFNWSQDTSDGTATTLYAGSFLEYLAETP